ncbi:cyclophilin-like fold protein [Sporosalibacterium faouarense]|uniref:cyclophilin-like fold protein n=1 Tax=Sporosalibacterium faouarense TaxID=516123 RepID=UPI001FB00C20|nr:cyclophilin-like fold protein [Sporosalibacterium faouarense]
MKKPLIFIFMISLVSLISACGTEQENIKDVCEKPENDETLIENSVNPEGGDVMADNSIEKIDKPNRIITTDGEQIEDNDEISIRMSFNNEEIIVKIYDNPTSRDFLKLLPLTLQFEDYAATEKISYLPRNLSTDDAPRGFDPSKGDLTLYAPWANLAIFYKDHSYANGLISLGRIESGIEKLEEISEDFTVVIEKVE